MIQSVSIQTATLMYQMLDAVADSYPELLGDNVVDEIKGLTHRAKRELSQNHIDLAKSFQKFIDMEVPTLARYELDKKIKPFV